MIRNDHWKNAQPSPPPPSSITCNHLTLFGYQGKHSRWLRQESALFSGLKLIGDTWWRPSLLLTGVLLALCAAGDICHPTPHCMMGKLMALSSYMGQLAGRRHTVRGGGVWRQIQLSLYNKDRPLITSYKEYRHTLVPSDGLTLLHTCSLCSPLDHLKRRLSLD